MRHTHTHAFQIFCCFCDWMLLALNVCMAEAKLGKPKRKHSRNDNRNFANPPATCPSVDISPISQTYIHTYIHTRAARFLLKKKLIPLARGGDTSKKQKFAANKVKEEPKSGLGLLGARSSQLEARH